MTELEANLHTAFLQHQDSIHVGAGLLNGAIRRGKRRLRNRRATLAAVSVLALVGSGVGLASLRDSGFEVEAVSGIGSWSKVDMSDPGVFSGDGGTFIGAVTPWKDRLVVLGTLQPPTGDGTALAWTSGNGIDWERHELDWPTGCDVNGGLAARGDELAVTCKSIQNIDGEDVVGIAVAVTTDLERWTVHNVAGGGSWFGSLIGSGPDGHVYVQVLEAEDPNTTIGSRVRVWRSADLIDWTEIAGETENTFLDAQATAIRTFDDVVVLTGLVTEWPDGANAGPANVRPASVRPALWVSSAGVRFSEAFSIPGRQSLGGVRMPGSGWLSTSPPLVAAMSPSEARETDREDWRGSPPT